MPVVLVAAVLRGRNVTFEGSDLKYTFSSTDPHIVCVNNIFMDQVDSHDVYTFVLLGHYHW